MSPRWRKVLNDLWGHKVRTLLAVLSIAAGVFAVGMISTAYLLIERDIDPTYAAVHPAHGEMIVAPFDDGLVKVIERLPGVEEAEGRAVLENVSILLGSDKRHPLHIDAVDDISALRMDRITLLSGDWPGRMEVLVIPSRFAQAGDLVQVELPDGRIRSLRVSGVVQDLNAEIAGVELSLSVYTNRKTLDSLGLSSAFNHLCFRIVGDAPTKAGVQAASKEIEQLLLRNDRAVLRSYVRTPDRHPTGPATAGLLGVMAIIGISLLVLGGFLVTNIISGLLAQQVRQIGMMKAVGARSGQVVGMYLVLATCFGGAALLLAAPVAPLAGYAMAQSSASLLNFALLGFRVFPASLLLMLAIGLIMPWMAALLPVLSTARLSARQAIVTYGTSLRFGANVVDRLVERFRGLPRPLLLSLRNTVRRKIRLGLTLSALAVAGAIFMSVFTARDSIVYTFDLLLSLIWTDLNLEFEHAYRTETIAQIIEETPGVAHVEGWAFTIAELYHADDRTVIDRFAIWAPLADSRFISRPPVTEGRWLVAGDQNALVISSQAALGHPDWHVGDTVVLTVNGRDAPFEIVGKYTWLQEADGSSQAYSSYSHISCLLGETGRSRTYRVMTERSDTVFVERTGAMISDALKQRGYTPTIVTLASGKRSVTAGADVIAGSLMVMALLTVGVGGIGLTSTMSMNVLERTREIGVMRAIGAGNGDVRRMIVAEGVIVGILSWAIGLGLSIPLSRLLCVGVGLALLQRPLDYVFSWESVAIWLGLIVVISALASLWPAINAGRLTIRDALAYE
jgi:putative ABC transport system permease protein